MKLPEELLSILHHLHEKGAKGIIVGGAVRDHFLGKESKDYDIEVYGLERLEDLEEILGTCGTVNRVGKSFGIIKLSLNGEVYDFSFPRRESKTGEGHKGFEVIVDGGMAFEEAARRRDFTLNAMGYDPLEQVFLDPFGGQSDLSQGILRHIDQRRFQEDPLRVYRAIQFAGRFGLRVAEETALLCQEMVSGGMLEELPRERVLEEWKKLLLKSPRPSVGFELMREWGIAQRYFPELYALADCPQDPKWHPEGDVWVHTMMALDKMREQLAVHSTQWRKKEKLKFLFAILCHDLGKPLTTTIEDDVRIRSIGHEKAGLQPTKSLMYRLMDEHDFVESLLPLVEHHLKPSQFYAQRAKSSAIRRLATKVTITELVMVAKADFLGRTTRDALAGEYPAGEWLLKEAKKLQVDTQPEKPLIQGRDLIAMGLKPSPQFKELIDSVYQAQLDGEIRKRQEALEYIKQMIGTVQ
jgi:tRNA nucleotidyltransferase (CCA-adding enzyme)